MHKNFFLLIMILGLSMLTTAQAPGSASDFSEVSPTPSKTQKEFDELNKAIQKIKDRWKIVIDTSCYFFMDTNYWADIKL